ncbi:battenin-like [Exaiptasia diaphana]|uniref:Battenin n=1 Tax=Exaiptasia diaphana TaxID=2652724 RepID=A0A913XRE0_EXADI|nr:battenin-like [Exaiptasia diaphana]
MVLTSTEDLLAYTSPPSSLIWLSTLIPAPIVTFAIPYVFDRLPPLVFVLALFPLAAGGLGCLFISVSPIWLKYLGIALLGVLDNTAGATGVCLTGYFENSTTKAFFMGSGFGYIFGPIYYTAMTSWFHVSYKIAIPIIVIMQPIVFLVCYSLLENRRQNVRMGYRAITEGQPSTNSDGETITDKYLTTREKFYHSLQILPQLIQLIIADILFSMTSTGVVTSLAFNNSPFPSSDHYKYYSIMAFAGVFVGRSYLGWADIVKPGLADKILIRRTWILVIISVCHVVILVLASWYGFLPNVWVPIVLVFTLGVCCDGTYTNISVVAGEIEDLRVRELYMGLLTCGVGIGSLCGTILASFVENVLVNHCLANTNDTSICFTREIDLRNSKLY